MTLFPAVLVLVDRHHAERAREQAPARARSSSGIHVPVLDRLTTLPRHGARSSPGVATAPRLWALPSRRLRLQPAQPAGQGHGVGGVGAAHPRRHRPLRLQRARLRERPSRSCGRKQARLRDACRRSPRWTRCCGSSRTTRRRRSRIIKSFAPLVAPIRIGRSSPVDLDRLRQALADIKRRFDVVAAEAGAKLPADLRRHPEARPPPCSARSRRVDRETAEPALNYLQAQLYRDFVIEVLQPAAEPEPAVDRPSRTSPTSSGASSSARTGASSSRSIPRWTSGRRAGARQFVRRAPDGRSGGHRPARHHLRGDPARWSGPISQGTALRLRPRRGSHRPDDPAGQGDPARAAAAGAGPPVDDRPHAGLSGLKFNLANVWGLPLIIGTSAEFGLNVILSYLEGRSHGGPLVARSTVMAVVAERDHDDGRLRQPDDRDAPGHLRPRPPAHDRHRAADS